MAKVSTINERMTTNEASEKYPDSYIVMQLDSLTSNIGTILFICDTRSEAFEKLAELDGMDLCGITEGINHLRSLGGIVVGG